MSESPRARVRVGTCSWTDRTLVEETDWYPKRSMSAEARLRYYAEHFSLAEADGTYYSASWSSRWWWWTHPRCRSCAPFSR